MSGTDDQNQFVSKVSDEKGTMNDESDQESEANLVPLADDPENSTDSDDSEDSNSQDQPLSRATLPLANGTPTQPKSSAAGVSPPPRCASPLLRQLLLSRSPVKPSQMVSSELQASTSTASEANLIPAATEVSKTEGGNVSVEIPSAQVVEASVPATVAEGSIIPEAIPSADAASNASAGVPAAEAVGGNLQKDESAVEAGVGVSETMADAAGSNVPKTISTSEVVGDEPAADAQDSNVHANVPAAEKTIRSTVDSVPASVPVTESKEDGGDEKMSTIEDCNIPEEQIAKEVDKVYDPAQSSKEISVSKTEPDAKAKVPEANVSETEPKSAFRQTFEPTEAMDTSEPGITGPGSGETSKPDKDAKQEGTDKSISKEAEKSPFKKPTAKGRLEDLKSDEPQTPKSPSRRSDRLKALQMTHSESPSPKKERKNPPSASDDNVGVRTRGSRVGSTSSNSEMEGSGDETKTKRVSRKDSKK